MAVIAFINFSFLLLAVTGFYIIGEILFMLQKRVSAAEGFFTGIFLKLLSGIIFSTVVFALCVSGFKTILSGFLLIAFFFVGGKQKKDSSF